MSQTVLVDETLIDLIDQPSAFDREEARLAKIVGARMRKARTDEFFHRTPLHERKSAAQQAAEHKEKELRRWDTDQCLISHCSIDKIPRPRSELAKRLRKNRLARERRAAKKAAASII